jgi:predicted metal-dependent hydrolase
MSSKSHRIEELIQRLRGGPIDAYYLGYIECFNQQLYFEAHEVLEQLWLPHRSGPDGDFYKGLIQLAGAFVHLQKNRMKPALSLFRLAEANLRKYPVLHHYLEVAALLKMIQQWRTQLESAQLSPGDSSLKIFPRLALVNS